MGVVMKKIIFILLISFAAEAAPIKYVASRGGSVVAIWSDALRSDGTIWGANHWESSWGSKTGVTIQQSDMAVEMAATLAKSNSKESAAVDLKTFDKTKIKTLDDALAIIEKLIALQGL